MWGYIYEKSVQSVTFVICNFASAANCLPLVVCTKLAFPWYGARNDPRTYVYIPV